MFSPNLVSCSESSQGLWNSTMGDHHRRLLMSPALWLWLSSKISYTACASRVFSGAEETTPHEPVSEDDSQEERERKERIPQRKADISRCWSKYCLDLLKTSRDKCVQEVRNGDQGDDDTIAGQGLITVQLLFLFAFTLVLRPGSEALLRVSLVDFNLRCWLLNCSDADLNSKREKREFRESAW